MSHAGGTKSTKQSIYSGDERRREPRAPSDEPASLKVLSPTLSALSEVRVLDISGGGMKLFVSDFLHPGMIVQVRLKGSVALGEVSYCVPVGTGFHVGLQVQEIYRPSKKQEVRSEDP